MVMARFNVRLLDDLTDWCQYFRFGVGRVEGEDNDWYDVWCQLEPYGDKYIVVTAPGRSEAGDVLDMLTEAASVGALLCDLRRMEQAWETEGRWTLPDTSLTKEQVESMGLKPLGDAATKIKRPDEAGFGEAQNESKMPSRLAAPPWKRSEGLTRRRK